MEIEIFNLSAQHSEVLSRMLLAERSEYYRHFVPFSFEAKALADRLAGAQRDRYWGIRCGDRISGMFMLRGFDEGHTRPSFGVYIAEEVSNYGLGTLGMQYALSWCRLNNIKTVMLKVHPENIHAQRMYERAGFRFQEVCSSTGHNILEKILD